MELLFGTYIFFQVDCVMVCIAGVLLTAICLMIEMCERSMDMLNHFRKVSVLF